MKKIITSLLAVALFLFSSISFAAVNYNPQFEFGTIPAENCKVLDSERGVTCDIEFQNTYDEEPLVFVMSTIDASISSFANKKTEYPSNLRVWSKSKTKATIKQLFPPHSAACKRLKQNNNGKWRCTDNNGDRVTFIDALMEDIDYLVIEPGVIKFDGDAMIVAGKVSSDLSYSNIDGADNESKNVRFSDYGLNTSFASAPGVLVQLQTKNNYSNGQPLWLSTIAFSPTEQGFSLILDRSEITQNAVLAQPEDVAFVAGLGQGFVNGRKFWLGDGSTRNTLGELDDNVIKPITEGCLQVSDFEVSGFKSAPVLLASKRTRNGNNGGWLRRCSVTKTGVALINEEDMQRDPERGHVVEPFSYFLFDKPPTSEICDLFPSPVQTWTGNSNASLYMKNNALISGAPLVNGKRYVGFPQSNITLKNSASCDNSGCFGNEGLMIKRLELESFQKSSKEVVVDNQDSKTFSSYEVLEKLEVKNNAKVTFKSGTYWIEELKVDNSAQINIPDSQKVQIHVKKLELKNNAKFYTVGKAELIIIGHGDDTITLDNSAELTGLLYTEAKVELKNNAVVYGAVTAKSISMDNSASIVATDNHCFTPSDNYEVSLSPATQYALMCGTEQPSFEIQTTNDNNAESTGVTVQVSPDADNFSIDVADSTGTGSYPSFTTSNVSSKLGKLKLQVTVTDQSGIDLDEEYTLKVTVDNDSSKTQTSTFKFVPFKFHVDEQSVIAGQAIPVIAQVLACSDGQQTLVKSYTGSPSVNLEIETPADGRSDKILTYEPKFDISEQGESSETFKLMDSGLYTIKLEDANFTCDPQYSDQCPIAPGEDNDAEQSVILNGSFSVKSRPWKIAICDVKSKEDNVSNPSSEGEGDGFIPAGKGFSVTYKPIAYRDSTDTDICDYPLTQNYFSSDNIDAPLDIKFDVAYPVGGALANLSEDNGFIGSSTFTKTEAASGKTVEYVWNEVGSLKLTTNVDDYLGMSLDEDSEDSEVVGRFYPHNFKLDSNSWSAADDQNDINYMGQPFARAEIYILPYAKGGNTALKNYHLFDFSLVAAFGVAKDKDIDNQLILDTALGQWGESASHSQWSLSDDSAYVTKLVSPNGPFNTDDNNSEDSKFGLTISGEDPVKFYSSDDSETLLTQVLTNQPPVRFGRVNLDDVGGHQGDTLRIPLRVEYWSGSRFVQNVDDDGTVIYSDLDGYPKTIWSDDKSDCSILLEGHDTVTEGVTRELSARQDPNTCNLVGRQQSRLWLQLEGGSNNLPWLKYDWDNDGEEENPSTVVTFGIHRGNDRVIYRGEPGLTAQ
ncbi:MAG: MSHA biogenesis protein MshQ [Vibrionaceae bacterium]|nr:MSHA biogenesis protein MshQ [Vibrionaceae bacterium]